MWVIHYCSNLARKLELSSQQLISRLRKNMMLMPFTVPPAPYCISSFQTLKSKLCNNFNKFRITLRGIITDLENVELNRAGHAKRRFDLVDPHGYYLSCCAMQHNIKSRALENMSEVILYFGTGLAPIGSGTGAIYLYNNACIIPLRSGQRLKSPKSFHVQITSS